MLKSHWWDHLNIFPLNEKEGDIEIFQFWSFSDAEKTAEAAVICVEGVTVVGRFSGKEKSLLCTPSTICGNIFNWDFLWTLYTYFRSLQAVQVAQ